MILGQHSDREMELPVHQDVGPGEKKKTGRLQGRLW
jgi:hypothetical protein